ncbi:hypothetical protein [Flagellimonas sp.]
MKTTLINVSKLALLLFLGLGITLVSCSGEDGKDGINGEMGLQGPAGQDGTNGQDGNANVIVSDWMHIVWDDIDNMEPPTWGNMYIEEIPGINDINAFLETGGVVLFYMKLSTGNGTATSLFPIELGNFIHLFAFGISHEDPNDGITGFVISGVEATDASIVENNDNYMVKYVVVPANIAQANDLTNNMPESFGEAATLLGLQQ